MAAVGCVLAFSTPLSAQSSFDEFRNNMKERYQSFRTQKLTEFEQYRNKINEEYAEFMRQAWEEHPVEEAEPVPPRPEPVKPIEIDPKEPVTNDELPVAVVKPLPRVAPPPIPLLPDDQIPPTILANPNAPDALKSVPYPAPVRNPYPDINIDPGNAELATRPKVGPVDTPIANPTPAPMPKPIPEETTLPVPAKPEVPTGDALAFEFYGTPINVPFDPSLRFSLKGTNENAVADGWQKLSGEATMPLLKACLEYREYLQLPDWAYIFFMDSLAKAAYPSSPDEATLLKMFLLTQSGYKVRIGKTDRGLALLIPSMETLYNYKFVRLNGEKYYVYEDSDVSLGNLSIFDREFPKEQFFSVGFNRQPKFKMNPTDERKLTARRVPDLKMDVEVNRNLIDFYDDYPEHSNWELDVLASLSDEAKEQMYPALARSIDGKTQAEAANIILNFVQTAFDYMTDEEQFGYERPLFPDETLFYPYCDCEDRAILFAVLVRDLLGLDVVLLHYPGHLASAVHFDEDVEGDHFMVDGRKFLVCDPTYINANIGKAMRQYKQVQAEIVKI